MLCFTADAALVQIAMLDGTHLHGIAEMKVRCQA